MFAGKNNSGESRARSTLKHDHEQMTPCRAEQNTDAHMCASSSRLVSDYVGMFYHMAKNDQMSANTEAGVSWNQLVCQPEWRRRFVDHCRRIEREDEQEV